MAVYLTRGRKYHTDEACTLMVNGEDLWDCDDEFCMHTSGRYRRTEPSPQYAAACGKLPCLHCVPPEQRAFPPLYGQTFGHEPVIGFVDGRGLAQICARCVIWTRWSDVGISVGVPVRWPCTSAKVLGIVSIADVQDVVASALQKRAESGGQHRHHPHCIHNLPPEQQVVMRGKTVEWWTRVIGPLPEQITPDQWETAPPT